MTGAALGILLMTQIPAALAFQPGGTSDPNFEIDEPSANALDDVSHPGDDWETIYRCTHALPVGTPDGFNQADCDSLGGLNSSFVASTGILHDHAPASIFTGGGSKDINDISQWKWKNGAVPDKDDITHAYASAYGINNALILYIGSDRFSNTGSAMMGAWFFQESVRAKPDGSFTGKHKNGDIFWTGEFTGGGVVANLKIYSWQDRSSGSCSTANRIKGSNLCLIAEGSGGSGYGYVASVNNTNETAPWDYTPKSGTPGEFPYNSFMKGGLNITQLLGGNTPCFASFMIETRSSSEVNAQLKDFVLGELNTCKISVTKTCTSSTLAADMESIDHTYQVSVTNTGYGTITSVDLIDDVGTPEVATDDRTNTYSGDILSGQTVQVDQYTINSKLNPPTNWVTAIGRVGTYTTASVQDNAVCPQVPLNPAIGATKDCETKVVAEGGKVVVKVGFGGQVCNTDTETKLVNVTANDSKVGALTLSKTTLAPEECASFTNPLSYYPGTVAGDGTPSQQSYSNTVSVSGTEPLSNTTVTGSATATCGLCPTCN